MIFVDSSVWIDFFNGRRTRETDLLYDLLGCEPILIGDIVLAEVLHGFREDRDFRVASELLHHLEIARVLDARLALKSARDLRSLRKRGITVGKTIDSIIATFCFDGGHDLLLAVRDFDPVEHHLGLAVVR